LGINVVLPLLVGAIFGVLRRDVTQFFDWVRNVQLILGLVDGHHIRTGKRAFQTKAVPGVIASGAGLLDWVQTLGSAPQTAPILHGNSRVAALNTLRKALRALPSTVHVPMALLGVIDVYESYVLQHQIAHAASQRLA